MSPKPYIKPYLLAPAGSSGALKSAIDAGADEIYIGGTAFNARRGATNFDERELVKAGELCRRNNVRLHITLNTLLFDRELQKALEYVRFLSENVRPDAIIVQDLGLACEIRRVFPSLALHASTQMRVHSPYDLDILKKLGFTRAVLARELPLGDIKQCSGKGIETEIFIHGALCVCESGGCLMSSVIGNRSGNRGECAQPCRLPDSTGKYPLSLKDLCLAPHIAEIIDSGVTSLKIEGRMKSPDYVYAVTSVYRRLLDEGRDATPDELKFLRNVFSRDGFTDGYFAGHIDKTMFGFRSEGDKQKSRTVTASSARVPYPPRAETAPTAVPPFETPTRDEEKVLSPKLQRGIVLRFEGKMPSERFLQKYSPLASRIDLPLRFATDARFAPYAEKISAIMPRQVFCGEMPEVKKQLADIAQLGIKNLTVTALWQFALAEQGFFLHGDYVLNVANRKTLEFFEQCSLSSAMLSPETDGMFPKGSLCALEYIGYGRTPLMHTRTCIIANIEGCLHKKQCFGLLRDRTGAKFPIISGISHTNTIYNSLPSYHLDRKKQLKSCGVGLITLVFTDESETQMAEIIELAISKEPKKPRFEYTRR